MLKHAVGAALLVVSLHSAAGATKVANTPVLETSEVQAIVRGYKNQIVYLNAGYKRWYKARLDRSCSELRTERDPELVSANGLVAPGAALEGEGWSCSIVSVEKSWQPLVQSGTVGSGLMTPSIFAPSQLAPALPPPIG